MILKDFHFQRMEAFYFDKQLSSQNRQNFLERQQQPSLKRLPEAEFALGSAGEAPPNHGPSQGYLP
jgi:hypothetical protein